MTTSKEFWAAACASCVRLSTALLSFCFILEDDYAVRQRWADPANRLWDGRES